MYSFWRDEVATSFIISGKHKRKHATFKLKTGESKLSNGFKDEKIHSRNRSHG
jgi:hypothetical protein